MHINVMEPAKKVPEHQEDETPEEREHRLDAEDGLRALREFEESGEKAIPLDEIKRRYGLT